MKKSFSLILLFFYSVLLAEADLLPPEEFKKMDEEELIDLSPKYMGESCQKLSGKLMNLCNECVKKNDLCYSCLEYEGKAAQDCMNSYMKKKNRSVLLD